VQWSYAAAGAGALAVYLGLPKNRPAPRGAALVIGAVALAGLLAILNRITGQVSEQIYFYVLTFIAVGGAARVVTHPRPVYAVLYFVMVVLATAGLAVLAGAEFLAAALVIVYAGAILVTYVFVIMLAQQSGPRAGGLFGDTQDYDATSREPIAAVLAGFVLTATIGGVLIGHKWSAMPEPTGGEANTTAIGRVLLSDFAVSVELAGVLLMIAMVGAIVLAKKRFPADESMVEPYKPGEIGKRVRPF